MYNHSSKEYICPICLGVKGIENENTLLRKTDLISKDDSVSVFMNSFFIKGNEGHIIIVPNIHLEHLYDLPTDVGHDIIDCAKKYAIILKQAYKCDGITIQQNNEPAGGQHAFHYHLHIFPRYINDSFYQNIKNKMNTTSEERSKYVKKIIQCARS
ncbi:MAG: HIT domain-containing protein [Microgenomates group bacterium]